MTSNQPFGSIPCTCGVTLYFINQPERDRVIVNHGWNHVAVYFNGVLFPDVDFVRVRNWADAAHRLEHGKRA